MKRIMLALLVVLFSSAVLSENGLKTDIKIIYPYEGPKIAGADWEAFHQKMAKDVTPVKVTFEGQPLEVFADEKQGFEVIFTLPGHPAHPAWVTRYAYQIKDLPSFGVIGYYAGEEAPFTSLFKAQQLVTKKMTADMRRESVK